MRLVHLLIILLIVLILFSNTAQAEMLERDDITGYKQEILSKEPLILKISGQSPHSALAVKRIYTKSEGKALTIYIKLIFAPGDYDYSGSCEYLLQVPDNVDIVQLGDKKAVIWERASGLTKYETKWMTIEEFVKKSNNGKTP